MPFQAVEEAVKGFEPTNFRLEHFDSDRLTTVSQHGRQWPNG